MWDTLAFQRGVVGTLRQQAEMLDDEQSVRGIDALDELGLHGVIARGLAMRRLERDGDDDRLMIGPVLREQVYPQQAAQLAAGRKLPKRTERNRCDLVVLPAGSPADAVLDDNVETEQEARSLTAQAQGSLFAAHAQEDAQAVRKADSGSRKRVRPGDALWVEIKAVAQHAYVNGVPVPNRTYTSQLTKGPIADLNKLDVDEQIAHAAAVVVLFASDEQTAEHDVLALAHKCLDAHIDIASPIHSGFAITDRIGNAWCHVALFELKKPAW